MSFPDHIFRAYDIRGVYPDELGEDLAYRVGRAYAELIKQELQKSDIKVAVGHDMRSSSEPLKQEIIRGITDQGISVEEIGLVATPTFYFAVGYYGYDGGLQVTASHNPKQYNGFKMVRAKATPIGGETGMSEIKNMAEANDFEASEKKGTVTTREGVLQEQVQQALRHIQLEKIKPLKVVVDAANGVGGLMATEIFKHIPAELVPLYFEPDGSFPNHEADPLKDENNKDLQEKVVAEKADLGIALDADADRLFFVDNTGKTIAPAITRGILSQAVLQEHPGAKIGYDIRPGRVTIDMIKEAGGVPVVTRVGHSLIKTQMKAEDLVFSGELSGHFYLATPEGTFDRTDIMILKFLQQLSESGQSASDYIQPYYRYHHSGEINFKVANKQAVFDRLEEKYPNNKVSDLDGLTFEWDDVWFNVRASNTENKVRLNLEGTSQEVVDSKVKEVSEIIKG